MTAHSESAAELILAVDAGGTKTVAWLASATGPSSWSILGRGRARGANPLSVGFDAATRIIAEAIAAARRDANQATASIARAVLSVAGAADPAIAGQFVRWARETKLAARVAVVSDVLPVLAAGADEGWGVALIAGTGSVAFGRSPDGRTARCGGWGYLLGDEGSGYAIGRAGLRHALAHIDHPDVLAHLVLLALQAGSLADAINAIYRNSDPRAAIAAVAPRVIEAAERGDAVATAMLDAAANDLAELVAATAESLGIAEQALPLALAGGVLVGSQLLCNQVESYLQSRNLQCDVCVVAEPLEGCLRLASSEFSDWGVSWKDAV